jgi:hypothetical protein
LNSLALHHPNCLVPNQKKKGHQCNPQWRLLTDVVHTQELVCAPELAVEACNTYTRRDNAYYPVKVRPMSGMWVQSVPVTTIPWGRMKTEQCNLVIRNIRKDD